MFFLKKLNNCIFCNSKQKLLVKTKTIADFNPNIFDGKISKKLKSRTNGICLNCGLFQNFYRFDEDELKIFNSVNKDKLTSSKDFSEYPPRKSFLNAFHKTYFEMRLKKWDIFLKKKKIKLKKVLIIRYWFGNIVDFLKKKNVNEVFGVEMSSNCRKFISEQKIQIKDIKCESNGLISQDIKKYGKFDAIFCFHILSHSIDINKNLVLLKSILNNQGFIVFSNEIERKPHNPFHNIHFSEYQLLMVLSDYFSKIDRIDGCELNFAAHVNPFTKKKDVPDFVAWK